MFFDGVIVALMTSFTFVFVAKEYVICLMIFLLCQLSHFNNSDFVTFVAEEHLIFLMMLSLHEDDDITLLLLLRRSM